MIKKSLMVLVTLTSLITLSSAVADSFIKLPPGNYRASCSLCRLHGNKLKCACKTAQGFMNNTSLKVPDYCIDVENNDGNLQCERYRRHHRHHHANFKKKQIVRDLSAGPIWNNDDANHKCPRICGRSFSRWTGEWHTIRPALESVCQCRFDR